MRSKIVPAVSSVRVRKALNVSSVAVNRATARPPSQSRVRRVLRKIVMREVSAGEGCRRQHERVTGPTRGAHTSVHRIKPLDRIERFADLPTALAQDHAVIGAAEQAEEIRCNAEQALPLGAALRGRRLFQVIQPGTKIM